MPTHLDPRPSLPSLPHWPRILALTAALLLLTAAAPAAAGVESQVRDAIAGLGQTRSSVYIYDITAGRELAAINADEALIPASNMKLLTSAAALDMLGADFRFHTRLLLDRGEGETAVIVRGDGDPAFCDRSLMREHGLSIEKVLDTWAKAVRRRDIERIDRLLVDDRIFDRQFTHPSWSTDNIHRRSWAQVAGLNFYNNTLDALAQPGERGGGPSFEGYPHPPHITTSNQASTGNSDMFWMQRLSESNHLTFRGSIRTPQRAPFEVTVHDPPLIFAHLFAQRLREEGIAVKAVGRPEAGERFEDERLIGQYFTTLPLVLQRCNSDSQNVFAEALLKRIGHHFTGEPGSWDNGAAAMRHFLQQRLGTSAAVVRIADGSGLSRDNAVTARTMVRLLTEMHRQDRRRARELLGQGQRPQMLYRATLAIGGRDGTLRRNFQSPMQGHVFAKTGYLRGVTTLSGYLVINPDLPDSTADLSDADLAAWSPNEHVLAFSLLFNNYRPPQTHADLRRLQERIVQLLARSIRLAPADQAEDDPLAGNGAAPQPIGHHHTTAPDRADP